MHKRITVAILLVVLTLLLAIPVGAQSRSVFWEYWDVVIDEIDMEENSFRVRELYNVRFSGTFAFGTAVIEYVNLEQVTDVQVYEEGRLLQNRCGGGAGTYCVQTVEEGLSINYYFTKPVTNANRLIEISYRVIGGLRVYEGGDQLWWTAIPSEHFGFPIARSEIRVELPPGYAPREGVDPVVTYGAPTNVDVEGNTVIANTTQQLGGNEYLEIRVQFPHNPDARVAPWQESFDSRREFEENVKPLIDLGIIVVSILIALGGTLGVYWLWYSRGRDPQTGPVPQFLTEPPSDLPPAVVGALIDEKADLRDILCTIIDLGHRGYLVIEETRKEGLFGLGGGSEFTFKRTDKPLDDLLTFEKNVVKRVFGKKMEVKLDALKNKFYAQIPKLSADLYEELVKHGLLNANPESTRNTYQGIGGVIALIAVVGGFLSIGAVDELTGTIICLPLSFGLAGVLMLFVGQHMPAKTQKGAEEAAKWNAFHEFLRNLEKYENVENVAQNFDRFLPYAVAFGIDRTWIRRFAKVPTVPAPVWYFPTYRGGYYGRGYTAGSPFPGSRGGGLPSARDVAPGDIARAGGGGALENMAGGMTNSLESLSSGLTSMLESASRTFTSRPQSSSSGSSGSWGGGGSSFSGGGFSGGGSSGGGSRGFG